jgi:hypothetical protein
LYDANRGRTRFRRARRFGFCRRLREHLCKRTADDQQAGRRDNNQNGNRAIHGIKVPFG